MSAPGPRLPVEALLATGATANGLSRSSGVPVRSIERAKAAGGFTPTMADKVATAVGLHPAEVWPLEWLSLPEGACGPVEAIPQSERDRRNRWYAAQHSKEVA